MQILLHSIEKKTIINNYSFFKFQKKKMKESDSSLSNSLNINPDIIEKQNLIKSNIIDKNYDKNLFFSFCMNKQGSKGDDLSNWTIEELKEAINNFIKEQNDKVILQNLKENENKNIENTINLDIENIPIPKKVK